MPFANLQLAAELLIIENGIQKDEDTSSAVNQRIESVIDNMRQRFNHFDLDCAEYWLGTLAQCPHGFAQAARGHWPLPRAANVVLNYMRNNLNEHQTT